MVRVTKKRVTKRAASSSAKKSTRASRKSSSSMASMSTSMSKKVKGKVRRKLSESEEFKLMLLVLDKFLWLGFGIMAFGLYVVVNTPENLGKWLLFMASGAVILVLFMVLLLREFEMNK